MPALERGCLVGGRYVIDSPGPIAEGTYARVYRATDNLSNGRLVAVKVEAAPRAGTRSLLGAEANVLRFLQRQPGIPRFLEFRERDEATKGGFVVMELLGEDLGVALGRMKRLSSNATAFVGLQMLRSIRAVHEKGLVHRDVKPNNIVFGRGEKRTSVYLIDFGLGRRHLNKDGSARQPRQRCAFRGTTRYASVSAQQCKDQARADDLWSLVFVLLELCVGYLPWNFYKSQARRGPAAKAQAKQRVLEEKQKFIAAARRRDCKPSGFLRTVPSPILEFLWSVDKLGYADVPDYDTLASLLRSVGSEEARAKAARRELISSDVILGLSLRDVWRLPAAARLAVAPAAPGLPAKKRRRLPTEEATTADTRDSKKSHTDRSIGTSSWAAAASERWWQLQMDRIASAEPLLRHAEAVIAACRETLGEAQCN